jgi:hypothetical protein
VLTLFAVFMTSGIVWHHLVARRRAIDAQSGAGVAPTTRVLERPRMWEVWVISNKKSLQWDDIQPLAAETLSDRPADTASSAEAEPTVSFWRRHLLRLLRCVPPEVSYLFHHRPPPPSPSLLLQPSSASRVGRFPFDGSDVGVSVLITMPHGPQMTEDRKQNRHDGPHEIVFGTTSLLYRDSRTS